MKIAKALNNRTALTLRARADQITKVKVLKSQQNS